MRRAALPRPTNRERTRRESAVSSEQLAALKEQLPSRTIRRESAARHAAKSIDARAHLIALLSGEAALRSGDMVALEWDDVDLAKCQLCVQRSAWKGQVAAPKGGRLRYVPLTNRLAMALREFRHLRGRRVLYQDDGQPLTEKVVQRLVFQRGDRD